MGVALFAALERRTRSRDVITMPSRRDSMSCTLECEVSWKKSGQRVGIAEVFGGLFLLGSTEEESVKRQNAKRTQKYRLSQLDCGETIHEALLSAPDPTGFEVKLC